MMTDKNIVIYVDEGLECVDPDELGDYIEYLMKELEKMKKNGLLKADIVETTVPICGQTPDSIIPTKIRIEVR